MKEEYQKECKKVIETIKIKFFMENYKMKVNLGSCHLVPEEMERVAR